MRCHDHDDGLVVGQIFFRHPVHVRHGDLFDRLDILVDRISTLDGEGLRPFSGQTGNRVAAKLRFGNLTPFGCFDQILAKALIEIARNHLLHVRNERGAILSLRKCCMGIAESRGRQCARIETAGQSLPFGSQAVKIAAPAVERIRHDDTRSELRIAVAGHALRDGGQSIGQIRLDLDLGWF